MIGIYQVPLRQNNQNSYGPSLRYVLFLVESQNKTQDHTKCLRKCFGNKVDNIILPLVGNCGVFMPATAYRLPYFGQEAVEQEQVEKRVVGECTDCSIRQKNEEIETF